MSEDLSNVVDLRAPHLIPNHHDKQIGIVTAETHVALLVVVVGVLLYRCRRRLTPRVRRVALTALAAAGALALLLCVGYAVSQSRESQWCYYRAVHRKTKQDLLYNVTRIIEAHNMTYWLAYGSALFAYRDGFSRSWDKDHDIYMHNGDHAKLMAILAGDKRFFIQKESAFRKIHLVHAPYYRAIMSGNLREPHGGMISFDIWTANDDWHKMENRKYAMNCCGADGVRPKVYLDGVLYPAQPWYLAHQMFVKEFGTTYLAETRPIDHDVACYLWQDGWDAGPEEGERGTHALLGVEERAAFRRQAEVWIKTDPWTLRMAALDIPNESTMLADEYPWVGKLFSVS